VEGILLDPEDEYLLSRFKWRLVNGYLATNQMHGGLVYLHRFLLNAPKHVKIEHINNNKLDNRKGNLKPNNNIKWKNKDEKSKYILKRGNNLYKYKWDGKKNVYIGKINNPPN